MSSPVVGVDHGAQRGRPVAMEVDAASGACFIPVSLLSADSTHITRQERR